MECVVKKDDVLAVLPTGCAFSRTATAGNATFSWNCIARDFRAPASNLVLWTSYLQIGPWDSEETLCIFSAAGLLSREDTEDGSALLPEMILLTLTRFTAMNFGLTTFIVL